MFDELNLPFTKVRIAALQTFVRSKNPSVLHVVRRLVNKVTVVTYCDGMPRLANRRLIHTRR
ncbi:hypothetical protein FCULG_00002693 [Fusarium culmorum]|uniref:Uncharacterized protein n=1 Tax=Fusarium culmorum TaxID=5516 RepID=A0A2T4GQM8_FUSCU|nr:hypothetical protein FCULG_00002693 [Fusarium culmorum]